MKISQRNFIKISAVLVMIFAASIFSGCGAGSSGSGSSNGNGGAYSLSIAWPDGSSGERLIPAGSESIYIIITGENIEGDPVTTSVSYGQTTVTIGNIPLGEKVATIQALGSSSAIKAQRKETFTINPGETTTSDHIPLGVAIINGTENKIFEPSIINIPLNGTLYFQNWTDSAVTITNLESTINLASASSSAFPSDWITASDFEVASVGESDCYINISDKAAIAGTVECDGAPLAGVTVSIDGSTFTTLADGKYRLFPLATFGTRQIKALKDTYSDYSANVTIQAGAVTTHDIEMGLFRINKMLFPGNTLETGTSPNLVASADFDGDGRNDIVTANNGASDVSVFLNHGNGGLSEKVNYPTGSYPISVYAADVSGDGKIDLITTSYISSGIVSVLFGNGDGTFGEYANYPVGNSPFAAAIADFDGDSDLDIAAANRSSSGVSILLNSGSGIFSSGGSYVTNAGPCSIAASDFNADGKIDIVTADFDSNTVSILKGNGNGTFTLALAPSTGIGTAPRGVAVSDLNSDGKPDIISANFYSNNISIFTNTSSGGTISFSNAATYSAASGPTSVYASDISGDNKPDILVANYYSGNVSVLIQNSNGTFAAAVNYAVKINPRYVGLSDVNEDGKPDMFVTNEGSNLLSILMGNGDGTFNLKKDYTIGSNPYAAAMADFNCDGVQDIITANNNTISNFISLLLGNSNGSFTTGTSIEPGGACWMISSGDFNKDTKPDVVFSKYGVNKVYIYLGNGNGTFTSKANYDVGDSPRNSAISDLNGDGNLDLIVANGGSDTVSILLGNGDGTFQAKQDFNAGDYPTTIVIEDVNNDTKKDIVVTDANEAKSSILLGNGNGTFQDATIFTTGASPTISSADLNEDGNIDLIVSNNTANTVSVFLGAGNGTFTETVYTVGSKPLSGQACDVNNDGKLDILTANYGGSTVSVLLGNGDGTFNAKIDYDTGSAPWPMFITDMNNDGKKDVITVNNHNNTAGSITLLLGQ